MTRFTPLVALLLSFSSPADAKERHLHVAFVLLSKAQLPATPDVAQAFERFAPRSESLRGSKAAREKPPQAVAVQQFELSTGETAFVALMPTPVPNGEAEQAARYSIATMAVGGAKMPPQKAHLIVALEDSGGGRKVDVLSRFTSLLAAVVQTSPAVGVYWGAAGATHDPNFFLTTAREPKVMARLVVWTGISLGREKDGRLSVLSLGMEQLGLPDLLLVAPKSAGAAAVDTFLAFLELVADEGKPIPEGDTIGRSAEERLRVHYVPSPVDGRKEVWRVELPR